MQLNICAKIVSVVSEYLSFYLVDVTCYTTEEWHRDDANKTY